MEVLVTESLAKVNKGLDKIPAKEVITVATIIPTCKGRIPGKFQLITG
jgi:hypothetical protein